MASSKLTLTTLFTLIITVCIMAGCTSGQHEQSGQFAFLNDLDIQVDEQLVLGDSLTLRDTYCGDPAQSSNKVDGKRLNHRQYQSLIVPAGKYFADEMCNWVLLGVRDMGSGVTLAAYYACCGTGYCVDLITYDKQGHVLDAINARELHLLWRIDQTDVENDTVFTLDGYFTFAGDRVTLHREMGRCVMDFDNDLKSQPQWSQAWEQRYTINAKGHFVLHGQQIVKETGKVDQYAALDFKSWDMLVCSLFDPGIMDTWNDYGELVHSTYDPGYKYNPFPWDVAQLYKMNPQRFLRWLAAPQNRNNRLLAYFKLKPNDRPAMMREIARIDDSDARQWLTSLVNSWDDQPLTKHL